MTEEREERMEKMISEIYNWMFFGTSALPPATVRMDRLEGFRKLVCWVGGSFFTIVVLGGGVKLLFVLFGGGE